MRFNPRDLKGLGILALLVVLAAMVFVPAVAAGVQTLLAIAFAIACLLVGVWVLSRSFPSGVAGSPVGVAGLVFGAILVIVGLSAWP